MIEKKFKIENKEIGLENPAYFIADIAANHDGDLNRAKDLIYLAAEAGADAAKFQHFKAETIVSDHGFRSLGNQQSHQSEWKKSVFNVYKDASVSLDWTKEIVDTCKKAGITFFTSPYSKELVDAIDPYVPAYKIGSGDITWIEMIEHIASKGKPYILASGASTLEDVERAVNAALKLNSQFCLMQCNTNYTASLENFKFIHLNVLKTYQKIYPKIILGLSDHTPGHSTVLGAIAFGAKMIEKHFTDDTSREGPDHKFSMDPVTWKEMVERTRELENAIGKEIKNIEQNEKETVVLQRRAIRLATNLQSGQQIQLKHLEFLRPCPSDGLPPYEIENLIGKKLTKDKFKGEHVKWEDLET
ncbi:N-acetylneuraminate synthase family protein [Candidatus Pelagibacter ubique]|nr:N-acetylneuraminate synthase family protein [Candidatus Pelagibacter ubique]